MFNLISILYLCCLPIHSPLVEPCLKICYRPIHSQFQECLKIYQNQDPASPGQLENIEIKVVHCSIVVKFYAFVVCWAQMSKNHWDCTRKTNRMQWIVEQRYLLFDWSRYTGFSCILFYWNRELPFCMYFVIIVSAQLVGWRWCHHQCAVDTSC